MRTIAAADLERHGLGLIDAELAEGPVQVTKHDGSWFVIMSEFDYQLLLEDQEDAAARRIQDSLADLAAGRVRSVSVAELAAMLDAGDEGDAVPAATDQPV